MKWWILNFTILAFYLWAAFIIEVDCKKRYKIDKHKTNGTQIFDPMVGEPDLEDLIDRIFRSYSEILKSQFKNMPAIAEKVFLFMSAILDSLKVYMEGYKFMKDFLKPPS
ncbi:hypothetical protein LSTR_LSTR004765 [Laodelphax striatellus]|uniref:Uncharacterized protein n=1 Tax=Laodelphax striatellus TaxID=195883 RepID=A0A482XJU9_LAOST|nr:hypothetical protein LSTR_LSTR004765 [Laodelphax striatellus]